MGDTYIFFMEKSRWARKIVLSLHYMRMSSVAFEFCGGYGEGGGNRGKNLVIRVWYPIILWPLWLSCHRVGLRFMRPGFNSRAAKSLSHRTFGLRDSEKSKGATGTKNPNPKSF